MEELGFDNCQQFLNSCLSRELNHVGHKDIILPKDLPVWAKERFPKACTGPIQGSRYILWKGLLAYELILEPHLLLPAIQFLCDNSPVSYNKDDIIEFLKFIKDKI